MKKTRQILLITLILVLSVPLVSFADVKGSTEYLVHQAKHYEGKTLNQVKNSIKSQGYNGWNMGYEDNWCAWYVSNCANAAYLGNFEGMNPIKKSTFVDRIANNFAKYNKTSKKKPGSYSPKTGDIVVEGRESHVGIMISPTKAAYGNDGRAKWMYTKVVIRKPVNVYYYVPRANWYQVYYSDDLSATKPSADMKVNKPQIATFGKKITTRSKAFKRSGYSYTHYYIFIQDHNKKNNSSTRLYWSINSKTGKKAWVKAGTANYTKVRIKVGSQFLYNYNMKFAGAKITLIPAWTKNK